ncbi:short-subunit dehydrogenase [Jatrophihabitans sp. GAS493]|uniref:SDR family oxidoreductase n=1 Tax=Jatrophihabitans sp. GAS493 TaxID=1907575 RepID=UPI000BC08FD0|nr:SDR family oxidoreductase [Jatrophihabitans sp. GAS493]SOD73382.1 short-subunit dehydrogenase [Jatrophihabitans sp. GAS493]
MKYLITGGTGFIGRQLVAALLGRDDTERILLLVREGSLPKAETLIQSLLPQGNHGRIQVIVGDLTIDELGIPASVRDALVSTIDHVVHLAAVYDITASEEVNQRVNVEGTRRVVELANQLGSCRLHHVSSIAVAGAYSGTFTEDMFDESQPLLIPYQRSKFDAERVVRQQSHVAWRIYRPGVVIGDSTTGEIDEADGPYFLFPTIAWLAGLPAVPVLAPLIGYTNIVPVDFVVAAMLKLMHEPGLDERAFHLTHPRPQSTTEVYNAFARWANAPTIAADLPLPRAAALSRLARRARRLPGAAVIEGAVLHRMDVPREVLDVLTLRPRFDSTITHELLAVDGIRSPELAEYADVIWSYWRANLDPYRARRHGPAGALDGRRVVITGASSGIGRATAIAAAERGAVVLLVARRAEELADVEAQIRARGGRAHSYPCDLTDADAVQALVKQMLADHDGIEMLVNNAGRSIRRSIAASTDRFHDFERAMALNYFGALRLTLELLPQMRERRMGHVVNVSTMGVQSISPRFSAYVASKAALDQFTRVAAAETRGEGVTFTTVHMPLVRTPMIEPTQMYQSLPALSPEQAAALVIKGLVRRPRQVNTWMGRGATAAQLLVPGLVEAAASEIYRLFPDSRAAGGPGEEAVVRPR